MDTPTEYTPFSAIPTICEVLQSSPNMKEDGLPLLEGSIWAVPDKLEGPCIVNILRLTPTEVRCEHLRSKSLWGNRDTDDSRQIAEVWPLRNVYICFSEQQETLLARGVPQALITRRL